MEPSSEKPETQQPVTTRSIPHASTKGITHMSPERVELSLFRDLFHGYDKRIRPVLRMEDNVTVELGISLFQLIDLVSMTNKQNYVRVTTGSVNSWRPNIMAFCWRQAMEILCANHKKILHRLLFSNAFYKIAKIVRTLWLAERRVCMRVCKHGFDVKMFCFSRANHASTNLKKFSSSKLDKFTLFTHSFVGWNLENLYKQAVSIVFA